MHLKSLHLKFESTREPTFWDRGWLDKDTNFLASTQCQRSYMYSSKRLKPFEGWFREDDDEITKLLHYCSRFH
ncbi:hypothetical protein E2320_006231 [Naja naja]|nr:hypothetical protein E2320_006231 [Naja naja]